MLIQFAVENFLSFRDKTVLSMVASDDTRHEGHVVTLPDGTRVLRCAALYGANASGKSNLIKALRFARELIISGVRPGKSIPTRPFKLLEALRAETRCEFEIWANDYRYSYGFVTDARHVVSEWLYRRNREGEQMMFERQGKHGAVEIKLGNVFGKAKSRVEFVAEGTRPEQLFLSETEERNVVQTSAVGHWFRQRLDTIAPTLSFEEELPRLVQRSPEFGGYLANYLRTAGTGVGGLRAQLEELAGEAFTRLLTQRTLSTGNTVEFEVSEESDGTRRLLDFAALLFVIEHAQGPNSYVIAIDEIERSLHPLLTRQFLGDYLKLSANSGQLLFTTHDTDLLDLGLLRPDEIWFAEKDAEHASRLYSLAEFKADQLAKLGDRLEDGYLNGRFGAIPFLGTREQLGLVSPTSAPAPATDESLRSTTQSE